NDAVAEGPRYCGARQTRVLNIVEGVQICFVGSQPGDPVDDCVEKLFRQRQDSSIVGVGAKEEQNLMKTNQRLGVSKSFSARQLEQLLNAFGVTRVEAALSLVEPAEQPVE